MHRRTAAALVAFVALAALSLSSAARAADTVETYDVGATDFELFAGFDGAGLGSFERTVHAEGLAGFGIVDRFSAYLGVFGEANERFSAGSGGASIGVFGTPVDTAHLDLDLLLDFGYGDGAFAATPGFEFNLDARPDLALCGLYLRASEVLEGRDDSLDDDPSTPEVDETREVHTFAPTTAITAGGYFTIGEIHQLLLEVDFAFHHGVHDAPAGAAEVVEKGGVALGYNVRVSDSIELVAQIAVDLPDRGERLSAGFLLGLVAAMPSPAAAE